MAFFHRFSYHYGALSQRKTRQSIEIAGFFAFCSTSVLRQDARCVGIKKRIFYARCGVMGIFSGIFFWYLLVRVSASSLPLFLSGTRSAHGFNRPHQTFHRSQNFLSVQAILSCELRDRFAQAVITSAVSSVVTSSICHDFLDNFALLLNCAPGVPVRAFLCPKWTRIKASRAALPRGRGFSQVSS